MLPRGATPRRAFTTGRPIRNSATRLTLAFAVAAASPALAATPARSPASAAPAAAEAGDACGLGAGAPARVASVGDDLELRLADGRRVRLAGIDPARATALRPGLGEEARGALAAWLVDRDVAVLALAPAPDRWNRTVAFVSATPGAGTAAGFSASEALVEAGWARARPSAEAVRCLPRLLDLEERARAEKRGLWSDPSYAALDPNDRDGLARHAGEMVLVEGILRVRSDRARSTLRLGGPGSAFRATLSRRDAKAFATRGLVIEDYVGTRVRLRGVLDDRFGPKFDLRDPGQFESLEPAPVNSEGDRSGTEPRP